MTASLAAKQQDLHRGPAVIPHNPLLKFRQRGLALGSHSGIMQTSQNGHSELDLK